VELKKEEEERSGVDESTRIVIMNVYKNKYSPLKFESIFQGEDFFFFLTCPHKGRGRGNSNL
jgi:hypothetical protein